jgi:hypothetical protein
LVAVTHWPLPTFCSRKLPAAGVSTRQCWCEAAADADDDDVNGKAQVASVGVAVDAAV